MKIMNKKVFREIWNEKMRSIIIIATVAATLGLMLGLRASYPMIMETYEENLRQQHVADGRFTSTAPISQPLVDQILENSTFLEENNIDRIDQRIILKTDLTYDGVIFPVMVVGVEFPNQVNELVLTRYSDDIDPESDFLSEEKHCIIDFQFAGSLLGQDIAVDENVTIELGATETEFEIKAVAQDTDFLYMVDPSSEMTLMGQMAVVWVDLGTLQEKVFGGLPVINQILFTVDSRLDADMTNDASDALLEYFAQLGIEVSNLRFTLWDETLDRSFFDADIGSIDKLGTIFGIIGFIVCGVAIFNVLSRIVQSQKRNIGLYMAMGAKKRKVVFHYINIIVLLSFIGILIGVPLGHLLAIGMTQVVVDIFGLTQAFYPLILNEYILGSLIAVGVCIVCATITAIPITKITPSSAMSSFSNRITVTKPTFSEKLFEWIPGFNNIHMTVPIREIFLRKKKSVVAILAVMTSMIILINSVGMVGNMYEAIDLVYDQYNVADVEARFENPVAIEDINEFLEGREDVLERYEVFLSFHTRLSHEEDFKGWVEIQCYQANSSLRNINIIDGDITDQSKLDKNNIAMGRTLADRHDLELGDEVELGTLGNYSVEISGFVGELVDFTIFWTYEAFQEENITAYFGIPEGYINGILLKAQNGEDLRDLRIELNEEFSLSLWIDSQQSRQAMEVLMGSLIGILSLFIIVGLIIGFIFSFSSMYMGFVSRETDFIAFKAMGTETKYLRKMIFWENAILSLFSLLLTIPIGHYFYWVSMDYIMGDRFYMPLSIPLYTWPLVFLLNLTAIYFATRRVMKKIKKMDLVEKIKMRMAS